MRVLITGSRDWEDDILIHQVLDELDASSSTDLTIISGGCPTGADAIAELHADVCGWVVERYPADWKKYGKKAGFIRNYEMVTQTSPDICIGFRRNNSKGTTMAIELAQKQGIEVRLYEIQDPPDSHDGSFDRS